MASMEKTAPETGAYAGGASAAAPPASRRANCFGLDLALRLLLFATTLSALVVLVTSKQTETVPTSLPPPFPTTVTRPAKFNNSPALIYLLVALAVTCFYSIVSMFISAVHKAKSFPSPKIFFLLILFDALMAGIMAAATGAAGGVAYIGLKGNSHIGWNKICGFYGKFCRHIGASTALSLVASVILVLLTVLSAYSLSRRAIR